MKYYVKIFLLVLSFSLLFSKQTHVCSFPKLRLSELVKYIGKSAKVNFIADEHLLDFDVVFMSNTDRSSSQLLSDLFSLLKEHKLEAIKSENSYLIRKAKVIEIKEAAKSKNVFEFKKLKYHFGDEILSLIKNVSISLDVNIEEENLLKKAIATAQWVKSSNTLFFSANIVTCEKLKSLIEKLDMPLKQVYVEVLVIETDLSKGHDFGVAWQNTPSSDILSACKDSLTSGLNLSMIGDAIVNGKKIFQQISSFAKFIQTDLNTSIVLNQKILARENKLSSIFEGDSIPFAGSVIQLSGTNERTTSNIDYKDVGVSLEITPMISDTGIITLAIDEKITESRDHLIDGSTNLSGIKTSKTQMKTEVHVPNNHFLILSGMSRKVKTKKVSRVPVLGYIPLLGSLFSSEKDIELKKSLIIFVRPHIVDDSKGKAKV